MSLKHRINMSQREKFELINSEVRSFYEYCKDAGMTDAELNIICRPLMDAVRKATIRRWTRIFMFLVILLAIGYTASQTETFQWHASAISRIVMIKILPIWNWTPLHYNKCLVGASQPHNLDNVVSSSDCITCEAVKSIARVSDTNYNEVFNHHLLRGAPVVVTDAHEDWSVSRTEFNLTHMIEGDDRLRESVPCHFLTNVRLSRQLLDLEEIVSRITDSDIPSWFVHFQNCDLKVVKAFRTLAPRPYFLSPHIRPSHFNWLLLSKNYDTHRFKTLELDDGLIIMSQLKGKSWIQLKPKGPCEDDCFTLNFELTQGETLVLGNAMWEFEYLPGNGDNVAMITETVWDES